MLPRSSAIVAGALVTSIGFAAIEALVVLNNGSIEDQDLVVVALLATWLLSSAAWSTVLWRAGSESNPDVVSRLVRAAFRGSALQVVLGLPLYIIVRRKESCWCSLFSFWSLSVGFASMFLLCGPGAVLGLAEGVITQPSKYSVSTTSAVQARLLPLHRIDAIVDKLPLEVRSIMQTVIKRILALP